MSEYESAFAVARRLQPPAMQRTLTGDYFVVRNISSGLYYVREHGFVADIIQLASVVGHGRAAWLSANSPKGTVQAIPVDGKPMLS